MAVLLFRLGGVPEEEAAEVRQLLDEGGFDTYETSEGRWKLSVAAIWLRDEAQLPQARAALDVYQVHLSERMQQDLAEREARGEPLSLWQRLRERPLQVIALTLAAAAVLTLSLLPFVSL